MVTLGFVMLGLTFLSSLVTIGALAWGHQLGEKDGAGVTQLGYFGTFVSMGALTISVLVMVWAFFSNNFTFLYVAENHSTDASQLAWLYKLSGLWAGREGSFLFWAWLITLFAAWIAYRRVNIADALSNMGLLVTNVVVFLFTTGMMFSTPNNPFKTTPAGLIDPATGKLIGEALNWGMNPLLQHWAMILHPPALFIGYAGLTIPFAFAIAALIVNDGSKRWVELVDRITVFSWMMLGIGIGLGSIWAYVELSFGGYWAWDPVENASLLPWLTGVALIHSFTMYRRRDGFKRWAIVMAAVTFALVILGTFITRSGIVQSVHAFQADPVSLYLFLGMIVGSLAAAGFGIMKRWDTFSADDQFESLTSKEAAYYFNNVIMLAAGLLVAYLTITSALPKWMLFGGRSIPAATFDAVGRPIGVLYLLILAVCPLLSWRGTDGATFWKRIRPALVGMVVIGGLLLIEFFTSLKPIYDKMVALGVAGDEIGIKMINAGPAWYHHGIAILGLLTGALLISTQTALFIDGARKRAAAKGTDFFTALWAIITKARGQSGGYLSHIGMGIILIGLVGSTMFVQDQTFTINDTAGSTFQMERYTFTYQGPDTQTLPNGDVSQKAKLLVTRAGKTVGTISPGQTNFATQAQSRQDAKVLSEPLRDIYVVLNGVKNGKLTLNVKINPLIWFAWIGFAVLLLGTSLAAWPKRGVDVVALPKSTGSKGKSAPSKARAKGGNR